MTVEEILSAIKGDKAIFSGVIAGIQELEEGKEFLTNHAKHHFEQNIGTKVSEIYNSIDNDIKDVLGITKKPEQKTYDFLKNEILLKLKDLQEKSTLSDDDKAKKIKTLEKELEDLKTKGGDDKFWKETHEKAVLSWEQKERELQEKIENQKKENLTFVIDNDLTKGLSGLKFNPNIPKSAVDTLIESTKNFVKSNAELRDGKVVYLKDDKTPWLNSEYKPVTAQDIFAEKLGDVLDTSVGSGGNAKKDIGGLITIGEGDNAKKKVALDPSKFNTKVGFQEELEKVLLKNGVAKGSKEWRDYEGDAYKEYGVAEMNRQ